MSSLCDHICICSRHRTSTDTGIMIAEAIGGVAEWPLRPRRTDQARTCHAARQRSWLNIKTAVRSSSSGAVEEEQQRLDRFVRFATWTAVAFSVTLPVLRLYGIAVLPAWKGAITDREVYAVAAVICYLPVQTWLVVSATRGMRGRRQLVALGALAAVMFGMIPVVGVSWVGILYMLAALVLVILRMPWSLLAYAGLVATPWLVCVALGQPQWTAYFTAGMLIFPIPLATLILLIWVVQELQAARLTLAEKAVVRERLRIDDEVRESVGAGLRTIAARGQRARLIATRDPLACLEEMRGLVDGARRTLAETRRMVSNYRAASLQVELETVATLLSTAGIKAHIAMPPEPPSSMDAIQRDMLRREVARLLGMASPPASINIEVTAEADRAQIKVHAAEVAVG
jgi:two-component system sensor histidine kinase DesK